MAFTISDRIKETTTTTGTGTYTLAGAVTGFETFTANLSNGDTTYYCCTDNSDFEVGLGTFASSGTTLARTTILSSSNSNSAVNWTSGTRTIFCTLPAAKAVIEDGSDNVTVGGDVSVGDDLTVNGGVVEVKNTGAQSVVRFYCESSNAHYAQIQAPAHADFDGNKTLTLPASTDTLVGRATTDTLTNKSLTAPILTGSDSAAGSILFKEDTDNGTNAVTLIGPASTADVTLTLPAATDTLVGKATTDTLTNKTFDVEGTGNSISNIDVADFKADAIVIESEGIASNDNDTTLPTSAAVKDFVDGKVNVDTTIIAGNTGVVCSDSGSDGLITFKADNNTEMTIDDNGVRIFGDFTVDGTSTTINTSTLSIEDNIIEVNRNVSAASGMPSYSGLKVNRGETSSATENDLFWVWDESFDDDDTTIHGNAGGAWTALRASTGADNASEITTTETNLVDIRCNVVHAVATSAQCADVAERFEADAPMATGAVVMVGGSAEITETTSELSDQVFGVISDQPAYAMNAAAGNNDSHPYVAMTGRTPVRVTGAVTKGQRLVSSSVKGCARAAATGESISPFHVIGRALETNTDTGIKLVNCAVRTNN